MIIRCMALLSVESKVFMRVWSCRKIYVLRNSALDNRLFNHIDPRSTHKRVVISLGETSIYQKQVQRGQVAELFSK